MSNQKLSSSPRKRSSFTLVELLIGMSLITIIVSTVFGLFTFQGKMAVQTEKIHVELLKISHARARLKELFLTTVMSNPTFFTLPSSSKKSLDIIFIYKAGVARIPELSTHPLGRLTLSPENELVLYTWPNPSFCKEKKPPFPFVREVILDDVVSCAYTFFSKDKDKLIEDNEWEKDNKKPPLFIKITATRSHGEEIFQFPIGSSCATIELGT